MATGVLPENTTSDYRFHFGLSSSGVEDDIDVSGKRRSVKQRQILPIFREGFVPALVITQIGDRTSQGGTATRR